MKGESHKLLKFKRHMKIREAGEWISVTWPGSQWQEINTGLPGPFYFCSLGNYGIYVMLCRDTAACYGSLTWALQHSGNMHLAIQGALENLKNEGGLLPYQGKKWWTSLSRGQIQFPHVSIWYNFAAVGNPSLCPAADSEGKRSWLISANPV